MAMPAMAQSTGAIEFDDEDEIIVTGAISRDVEGIAVPDTPKASQVLDEEIIRRQRPGQTVNDIVNLVPGVSFQNNDPWGSAGGSFTIRGFDDSRISQTLDGLPLNDSGNYALYTNQQVDPEVLESVNVNLGVTDVDSPTASAVGGTINIRTRQPSDIFKITANGTIGDIFAEGNDRGRLYTRGFIMIDTGDITGSGLKAFASASYTNYENPFNNYGKVKKQQYNASIWQDLGDNGDFVSVSGHYNQNRNNFFGSLPLRLDPALTPGSGFGNRFPLTKEERFYEINYPCTVDAPTAGVRDVDNNCGAEFDRRYNPSNTGNIRGASRFTLSDNLVLTVDPSYQYVKANGGGDEELLEQFAVFNGQNYTGYFDSAGGRQYYYGRDLNGDGDTLDEVTGNDPSQTRTHRFGVISSLVYDINPDNRIRLAYTWDRANHRQTGQTSVALPNGEIADVFPINDPLITADGFELNKRNRQSYAILHQISGEYRGQFNDFTAVLGLRAPFFTRELDQRCYTESAGGDLACFENQDPTNYLIANPDSVAPQQREYDYNELLPNVGFVYELGAASLFGNYARGLSVPGTDVLYDSLFFADAQPEPETTDSFDLGVRYRSGTIQAQLTGWLTKYDNRLATAYDPILDETTTRNLGRVDKYGVDGSIAWSMAENALLYVFGSINESEIKENVQDGVVAGEPVFLDTAGKRESGAPLFTVGARAQYGLGPVVFGAQVKHTGKRYVNDENLPRDPQGFIGETIGFPATVDPYTLVDLDIRWTIGETSFGDDVALQLNVTNLFDELYVGGFGGALDAGSLPFVQIGPPRAASISLIYGY
jgi:iron complex outermembrane receptor protein